MPTIATGVVTLTSELASFVSWPDTKRNAPASPNLIVPLPAAGSNTYVSSVSLARSPSVSCVLSLKVTSSRAVSAVDKISLRNTEALRLSARVAPLRVALASPWMRLTVPIASCATD